MEKKRKKYTKKTKLHELLKDEKAVKVLTSKGIHCIGCPMAMLENIEEGCKAHGLNVDKVVEELNKKIRKRK